MSGIPTKIKEHGYDVIGTQTKSDIGEYVDQDMEESISRTTSVLSKLQPGKETFRITTMKGLYLRSVLYSRYYYNLSCEASWVVETGSSSTQDKSRIVNSIVPFIMQCLTPEDITVLNAPKPESSSEEFNTWNSDLKSKAAEIEERLQKQLESEEDIFLPPRDKSKLRRKHMYVNGVDSRLADIKKVKNSQKSKQITSFCTSTESIPTSSSLSSSSIALSKKSREQDLKTQQTVMSAFIKK